MLYVGLGGAALVAYYLYEKGQVIVPATVATPVPATTATGYPVPDFSGQVPNNYSTPGYFEDVLYPAAVKYDPQIGNPGYTPTDAECTQLLQNYLDLRQGLQQRVNGSHTMTQVVQDWWHTNGVPEKRIFLPLVPSSAVPYTGPLPNANSSGSGSTLKTIGTVASIAAMILGVGEGNVQTSLNQPLLNDYECEVLITGAAIAFDIIPFYYSQRSNLALQIEDRMEALVEQYTQT